MQFMHLHNQNSLEYDQIVFITGDIFLILDIESLCIGYEIFSSWVENEYKSYPTISIKHWELSNVQNSNPEIEMAHAQSHILWQFEHFFESV